MINARGTQAGNPRRRSNPPITAGITTKRVQDYLIFMNELLGQGNFSCVYRGVSTITNEPVAVKVVELSSLKTVTLINLLRSEIEILRTLNHPNVLRCYDIISSANNCYIVTELCNEGDLESIVLKTKGTLEQLNVKKFNCDIYQGLKYLAEQHIVHRDLKVANIFISDGVAKIADFGFAKRAMDRFKDVNVGSPIYMPPEALLQSVYSPKTDVWAYGIILYELLHGNPPLAFCRSEQQLKANIAKQINPSIIKPSTPEDLKDLIMCCLDIDQNRRINAAQIEYHPYMRRIMQELGSQRMEMPRPQSNRSFQNLPPSAFVQNSVRSTSNDSSQLRFHQKIPQQQRNSSNQTRFVRNSSRDQEFASRNQITATPTKGFIYGNTSQNIQVVTQNSRSPSPQPRYIGQNQTVTFNQPPPQPQNRRPRQNNFFEAPPSKSELQRAESSRKIYPQPQYPLSRTGTLTDNSLIFTPSSTRGNISSGSTTSSLTDPSALTFDQSVQFLHYCRLLYKSVQLLRSNQRMSTLRQTDFLTNWLLLMMEDLEVRAQPILDNSNPRHLKLKTVLREYNERYNREFKRNEFVETSMNAVKSLIEMVLQFLDTKIFGQPDDDLQELIIIGEYLCFLQQTNAVVKRCVETRDYAEILGCNVDHFLNIPPESFNVGTYRTAREKLKKLIF